MIVVFRFQDDLRVHGVSVGLKWGLRREWRGYEPLRRHLLS